MLAINHGQLAMASLKAVGSLEGTQLRSNSIRHEGLKWYNTVDP